MVHHASCLYTNAFPSGANVFVMTHRFRLLQPDPVPARIHSPVGLGIGAEGPDEISVSIVSELIRVRSSKQWPPTVCNSPPYRISRYDSGSNHCFIAPAYFAATEI